MTYICMSILIEVLNSMRLFLRRPNNTKNAKTKMKVSSLCLRLHWNSTHSIAFNATQQTYKRYTLFLQNHFVKILWIIWFQMANFSGKWVRIIQWFNFFFFTKQQTKKLSVSSNHHRHLETTHKIFEWYINIFYMNWHIRRTHAKFLLIHKLKERKKKWEKRNEPKYFYMYQQRTERTHALFVSI